MATSIALHDDRWIFRIVFTIVGAALGILMIAKKSVNYEIRDDPTCSWGSDTTLEKPSAFILGQ